MHFVVFYIDVVVVVVVVVWYAPCEQLKTNTKQCKVLQILLIDRGTRGKLERGYISHITLQFRSRSPAHGVRVSFCIYLGPFPRLIHPVGGGRGYSVGTS